VSDEQVQPEDPQGEAQEQTGKGLRAQLERALAENKELRDKYQEAAHKARQSELVSYLSARDINPKIARFIPQDVQGEEALGDWLKENGELFGIEAPKPDQEREQVDPSVVAAAKKMQGLSQKASTPSGFGDIAARVKGANSKEELAALVDEARAYSLR
jgi:hypothetical protein